jgi:hypothetical protein
VAYVVLVLAIVAVIVGVGLLTRRKESGRPIDKEQVVRTLRQSGGWIELCNVEYQPIFQGWLFTILADGYGLAIGVLLEQKAPPDLVADLKKYGAVSHVCADGILAKCLIDFNGDLVFTGLKDEELKATLKPHLDPKKDIPVKLLLNSVAVSADVDKAAFSQAWADADRTGQLRYWMQPIS